MRHPRLSPNHKKMLLKESDIRDSVIVARGYRTVTKKAELERLGFARSQRNVPGLLLPIHGPAGGIVSYQLRPDEPRIGKNGKSIKYETPAGSRMVLDAPPGAKDKLADPSVPLFVTEGIKKGDALASRDLCPVALIGVWNWRGANEAGGKVALTEWEAVALNGRQTYVVFDSDVMLKPEVHAALVRFKAFLESRGAKVALIYLPTAEAGKKQGVDDYLSAGHTADDMLALATHELRKLPREERPAIPYRDTPGGLVWEKPTQNGSVPTPLTNFDARIVGDVSEDDGAEVRRVFEIEATLNGRRSVFGVQSGQFAGMGWVTENLGPTAILYPGIAAKEHARTAIQMLSGEVPTSLVYEHTGWREVDGEWVYLHANGAIGRIGRVEGVRTELGGGLAGRALPRPPEGDQLREAVRASLRFLELAPPSITVPLLCCTHRAVMGETDSSAHLSGPSGEGKSELAALVQQHFGPTLDARNLASWESTENAIEALAFLAKDQVIVLDDFAPTGTAYDVQRWHKKADRVMRAKGNASGRQRMRADTTLRPEKPPRAFILSTGEDVPRGQSLRARMLVLELAPGDLDWDGLTRCQRDAASGLYAQATAGFVLYLATRYEEVRSGFKAEHAALREAAGHGGQHRRTAGIVADLALGLRYFLNFAHDTGALTTEQAEETWGQGWRALGEAAAAQGGHQAANEPTSRFRELLSAAIASGGAHVAGRDGDIPTSKEHSSQAWGWHGEVKANAIDGTYTEWRHQGDRVGWLHGEDLYLEPEAAFAAAQKQGRNSGEALTIAGRTLRKRLDERGLLVSKDAKRGVLTVRRALAGSRRDVLHTRKDFLFSPDHGPDRPDHEPHETRTYAPPTPPLWSGSVPPTRPAPGHKPDREMDAETDSLDPGELRSENGRKPGYEPDRHTPPVPGKNRADGRVGRVLGLEEGNDGSNALGVGDGEGEEGELL